MVHTLCDVLGTFLGTLGGVKTSTRAPPSCPKTSANNLKVKCSVLNWKRFIGDPSPLAEEHQGKIDMKSLVLSSLT